MKVDQTVMQFRLESAYYENFSDFSSAIYGCLNDADLKHKKQLDSLLTLGFQKFNKSQIMNVQSISSRAKLIS